MAEPTRPLSPQLDIYQWQISNSLSILHRMTGVFMTVGGVFLVCWLVAAATGPDAYAAVLGFMCSPIGLLLLAAWSFCFFYHFCNGLRHLGWDAGYGFDKDQARRTGWLVVFASLVLTAGFWGLAWNTLGGGL
jgi:succinate dehydrogenase / fumarate reductase cytochrome b subunit